MRKILIVLIILSSCAGKKKPVIDRRHVEELAKDFMKTTVIPKMSDPKPYEVDSAKVIIKTVADQVSDYRFVYDHLSTDRFDSVQNKRYLDSIISVSKNADSIVSITVNVSYKTRYQYGDVVVDSIKLAYHPEKDKISYWPF